MFRRPLEVCDMVYVSLHRTMLISTGAVYVSLRSVYGQIAVGPC